MEKKKPAVHETKTSWGGVAQWYDTLLQGEGTYQKDLILPNLLRLVEPKKNEVILDLACGQGFFSREFAKKGARVIGADISKELIAIAKKNSSKTITYYLAAADRLSFVSERSVDVITLILALQNIENVQDVLNECKRVLKPDGELHIVMNHPAFRVPKGSSWGWDPSASSGQAPSTSLKAGEKGVQYRRIDSYLSESKEKIQMHPSASSGRTLKPQDYTTSFHRPLQYYFKAIQKAGLFVARLEEWSSHKKSEPGLRAKAENIARAEIPLFLYFGVRKHI